MLSPGRECLVHVSPNQVGLGKQVPGSGVFVTVWSQVLGDFCVFYRGLCVPQVPGDHGNMKTDPPMSRIIAIPLQCIVQRLANTTAGKQCLTVKGVHDRVCRVDVQCTKEQFLGIVPALFMFGDFCQNCPGSRQRIVELERAPGSRTGFRESPDSPGDICPSYCFPGDRTIRVNSDRFFEEFQLALPVS